MKGTGKVCAGFLIFKIVMHLLPPRGSLSQCFVYVLQLYLFSLSFIFFFFQGFGFVASKQAKQKLCLREKHPLK